jgi:hypothetical protein
MNEFWIKYYSGLEGATIIKLLPFSDDNINEMDFISYLVKFADGTTDKIEISQDPEGNGPGFIFGLPVPNEQPHLSVVVVGNE